VAATSFFEVWLVMTWDSQVTGFSKTGSADPKNAKARVICANFEVIGIIFEKLSNAKNYSNWRVIFIPIHLT